MHNDKQTSLVQFDLAHTKKKVLAQDFDGTINRGSANVVFASSTDANKFVFGRITDTTYDHLQVVRPEGNVSSLFEFGQQYLFVDYLSQASLISKSKQDTAGLPVIKNSGLEKSLDKKHVGSLYDITIDLSNAATSNTYAVNIYPPYQENTATFIKDVKTAGYDPNQLDLYLNYTIKRSS